MKLKYVYITPNFTGELEFPQLFSGLGKLETAADVPSTGLGAVIFHTQDNGQCLPICYISRSLSDAEGSYAVMEKEVLTSTWACKHLEEYYFGLRLNLETDQKPLAPLLTTTNLSKVPPQILPLPTRMMQYNPKVLHIPGKC